MINASIPEWGGDVGFLVVYFELAHPLFLEAENNGVREKFFVELNDLTLVVEVYFGDSIRRLVEFYTVLLGEFDVLFETF